MHDSLPLVDIQSSFAYLAPFFQRQPLEQQELAEMSHPHGNSSVHLLLVYNSSALTQEDKSPLSTVSKFLFLLRFFREYVPLDCVSFLSYDVSSYRTFAADMSLRMYLLHSESQAKKYDRVDVKATIVELLRLVRFRDKRIRDVKIREADQQHLRSIKEVTSFIADSLKPRSEQQPPQPDKAIFQAFWPFPSVEWSYSAMKLGVSRGRPRPFGS